MESLDDGPLWQMTLGSSPIHRAITLLCFLDVPGSAYPLPGRAFGTKPAVQMSSMIHKPQGGHSLLVNPGRQGERPPQKSKKEK